MRFRKSVKNLYSECKETLQLGCKTSYKSLPCFYEQDVRHEQENIIKLYKKDISKYIPDNKLFIKEIFDRIPSELNAQNKRFILKSLNDRAKFEKYENSFLWLTDAGVALPTYNVDKRLCSSRCSFAGIAILSSTPRRQGLADVVEVIVEARCGKSPLAEPRR